jgi:phage-related protein
MGEDMCDAFGADLLSIKWGIDPATVKHMAHGISEIKINDETTTHRLMYVAKYEEKIYVLHAFTKKSHEGDKT